MVHGKKRDRYIENEDLKKKRRDLRKSHTKAESVLWQELRNQKLGYKFRRQASIGKFIVDFYCHELRIVIELDGPIHEYQAEYDIQREQWLQRQGYFVIRFINDQVLFEREVVVQSIEDVGNILSA